MVVDGSLFVRSRTAEERCDRFTALASGLERERAHSHGFLRVEAACDLSSQLISTVPSYVILGGDDVLPIAEAQQIEIMSIVLLELRAFRLGV